MSHKAFDANLEQMIKWQEEFAKKIDPAIFEQSAAMKDLLQQIKFPKVDLSSTTDAFRHYYQQRYDFEQALEPLKMMSINIKAYIPVITDAASRIASIQSSSSIGATAALTQYANSLRQLTLQVDWKRLQSASFDTQIEDETIEAWYDSASEIIDDMVEVGWIKKDRQPTTNKSAFAQLPLYKKVGVVIAILAGLASITGFNLRDIYGLLSDIAEPPAINRELTDDEVTILICQSQLNISVSGAFLSSKPENPLSIEPENLDD